MLRTGRFAAARLFAARSLATDATKTAAKEVKLPAQVYGVPGRYANALYVSAVKANQLEKVAEELQTFMKAYDSDANLKRYVRDPSIPRNTKADTMISVLKQNTDVTKHFFGVLAKNGRMAELEAVAKDFNVLMQAHKKQVAATVTTVVDLTNEEIAAVKEALKGFVKSDETIVLECQTDPDILGGMVVSVGDRRIDLSFVRTMDELQRLVDAPVA